MRNTGNQLLGVKIGPNTIEDLEAQSLDAIRNRSNTPFILACANPHSLVVAQEDRDFMSALNNASATVADGAGVTLVSRILHIDTGPRITGNNYFNTMMRILDANCGSVFFFGSSDFVLDRINEKIIADYPGISSVTTLSPPFGDWSDEENAQMIKSINDSSPDVLWVGMTAPKQEKWIEANRNKLDVPVIGAIGAVFDFYAETYPRAPWWARRLGLEWLVRLIENRGACGDAILYHLHCSCTTASQGTCSEHQPQACLT